MSKLVKLYRMEYKNSKGMYSQIDGNDSAAYSSFTTEDYEYDEYNKMHPSPSRDRILCEALENDGRVLDDFFFAFKNIKTLRQWIPHKEWLQNLHNFGIVLAVYTCPFEDVLHGERQSLFASHVRKRQYNIEKYFSLKEHPCNPLSTNSPIDLSLKSSL